MKLSKMKCALSAVGLAGLGTLVAPLAACGTVSAAQQETSEKVIDYKAAYRDLLGYELDWKEPRKVFDSYFSSLWKGQAIKKLLEEASFVRDGRTTIVNYDIASDFLYWYAPDLKPHVDQVLYSLMNVFFGGLFYDGLKAFTDYLFLLDSSSFQSIYLSTGLVAGFYRTFLTLSPGNDRSDFYKTVDDMLLTASSPDPLDAVVQTVFAYPTGKNVDFVFSPSLPNTWAGVSRVVSNLQRKTFKDYTADSAERFALVDANGQQVSLDKTIQPLVAAGHKLTYTCRWVRDAGKTADDYAQGAYEDSNKKGDVIEMKIVFSN